VTATKFFILAFSLIVFRLTFGLLACRIFCTSVIEATT
ncbi:MAG: hypothetical protein RL042_716, partial [Nitrospirota bacterium]